MIALFSVLQITGNLKLVEACSVFCPDGEKICRCKSDKPEPTPDPITGSIVKDSCNGFIHYCSVGGICKPKENGCPIGK